ncbi:recombinase family protein [Endozoicomonas sp. 4G]|uniref:recombinase family protein n=1 Tax=Endozoicomonas sp. 4G TaxID=2872754 RepID=UPI002078749A|nr:recombinase family protein [Endozoicomonas sp. 4G]
MTLGYARVSTTEQDLGVQLDQLTQYKCDKIFSEKLSGKNAKRAQLQACIEFAREGDTIVVAKVDRIARRTVDALEIADKLRAKGVGLRCLDLGDVDINSDVGRMIYTTIAAFAEMERKRILQRCNEGRAKAKADGKHLGRSADTALHGKIVQMFDEGHSKLGISKALGCSRATVYRVLSL